MPHIRQRILIYPHASWRVHNASGVWDLSLYSKGVDAARAPQTSLLEAELTTIGGVAVFSPITANLLCDARNFVAIPVDYYNIVSNLI
jgi:hypothetical protein